MFLGMESPGGIAPVPHGVEDEEVRQEIEG